MAASTLSQPSLPPDTTEQQDITHEGQRKINLIWEGTQSRIAVFVVAGSFAMNFVVLLAALILMVVLVVQDKAIEALLVALISASLQSVNLTLGMVIGFYFSRTNHQAIGGVGARPSEVEAQSR